jgi:cysteine synthase
MSSRAPDFVFSALGNGTTTLGFSRKFSAASPETKVVAYEMLSSGVGYSEKYGESQYRNVVDSSGRFGANDFTVHKMPGTSFPGIDFPALKESMKTVDRVILIADTDVKSRYQELTGKEALPEGVVSVEYGQNGDYGHSTDAGIAIAKEAAKGEEGKNFVVIAYDTIDRY